MAFALSDRVKQQTAVTGTGPVTLPATQLTGFQTWTSTLSNGDTTWYAIVDNTLGAWEVGLGTWSGGNTLTRTTVYASSNAGLAVSFAGNTCDVFQDIPANVFPVTATPGGSAGDIQFNDAGTLGGFTASGDATINTTTGAVTVSKYNAGTTFGSMAAQASTNVSITGGTIDGLVLTTLTANTIVYASGTATLAGLVVGSNLAINSGTLNASNPGTGTVTSVAQSFTGGLISVGGSPITGAGTLALTVAGTLDGLPYFNTGTTWASTAAVPVTRIVVGGATGTGPTSFAGLTFASGILTLGVPGTLAGAFNLSGITSGQVLIATGSNAGTWTFRLPNSAGTTGQFLTSGGGGAGLMTWTSPLATSIAAGVVSSDGTVEQATTLATGLSFSGATLTLDAATGSLRGGVTVGAGLAVSSGTVSIGTISAGMVSSNGTILQATTLSGASFSGATFTIPPRVLGIMVELAGTLGVGTYDLGPVINGGTVLNSYAHVGSGTITYTGAIGAPGTYTAITGLTALAVSSTTVDTIGTPSAANVLSAGQHLFLQVGTAAVGGSIFFSVKTP